MAEMDPRISQVMDLWRRAFGEPPAILVAPEQMLVLIEFHGRLADSPRETFPDAQA